VSALQFEIPPRLEAHEPPEARGLRRGDVRLLVVCKRDARIAHAHFPDLAAFLAPGDLLVVNTSGTLAAALPARRSADGWELELRLSTPVPHRPPERWWIVELRADTQPFLAAREGDELSLPGGGGAKLVVPFAASRRLWLARLDLPEPLGHYLEAHGHPIRYGYVAREWPLSMYQTVFATEPGSAEMPSAGRPFTTELVTRLVAHGVHVAPVTLHTGVSSPERGEAPYPERYRVPAATARLVNAVRSWGGRVIAVGTTVVRALETVANGDGTVAAGEGWTNHVVCGECDVRAVDGLITGWHEPEATHLQMLRALANEDVIGKSYREALAHGYLWHEFGDSHLILP
jgi:S-adenosylmethionine:tRNA ribosyltransferase-isomerase